MKILYTNNDLIEALKDVSKLGFVPTMGGLHNGHISLIKKSKKESNKTIVSIFVNPKQFNDRKDFNKYPRNYKKDLFTLKRLNVNYVYIPTIKQVYNFKRKSKIKLFKKDMILCAKHRKGHFEGVLDVMDRLTKLIKPKKIFMGEKDFQQYLLVKNFINKNKKTSIVLCKTIRDKNKIALSTRNLHLSKKELTLVAQITQDLIAFKKKLISKKDIHYLINVKKKILKTKFKLKIDYLELRNKKNLKKTNKVKNSKLFIAYHINKTRLIDNF